MEIFPGKYVGKNLSLTFCNMFFGSREGMLHKLRGMDAPASPHLSSHLPIDGVRLGYSVLAVFKLVTGVIVIVNSRKIMWS